MAIIKDKFTKFDTLSDYESAMTVLPNVSKISNPRIIKYKPRIKRMWVDDFPEDKIDEINVWNFVQAPKYYASNPYILTNDTLVINGTEYYLWEYDEEIGNLGDIEFVKYLLTTSNDYYTLYNESLESNGGTQVVDSVHLYGILNENKNMYRQNNHTVNDDMIVKIELYDDKEVSNVKRIWVDDFPEEKMDDININYFVSNPSDAGCNPYVPMNSTLRINGKEYDLWVYDKNSYTFGQDEAVPYLLTTSTDYDVLYLDSIAGNNAQIANFTNFFARLSLDKSIYITDVANGEPKLVKVEPINN